MFKKFITRTQRLAAKILTNDAMRIYVQNVGALQQSGFYANNLIKISCKPGRIEITLDPKGENKVFDTGRGELIELKSKKTHEALGSVRFVTITYRTGKIIIEAHQSEKAIQERVKRFRDRIISGEPLVSASLFSGLNMLSYHIKNGLARMGLTSRIAFANDADPLAMALNVDHNPVWLNATDDAQAVTDLIQHLMFMHLPQVDWVDISYPCVAFSKLADVENKDTAHPFCGTLFVSLLAVLRKMNPAVLVFENVPAFAKSQTLDMIKRELPDYAFNEQIMSGHDFGEMEDRKRVAIIATSEGLPPFDFSTVTPLPHAARCLGDILEDISPTSPLYREMAHVRRRDDMPHLGYRNCLYGPEATKITTATASYAAPKAGSPMVKHPTDPMKQRQITVGEHATLRDFPPGLHQAVCDVESGAHPMVSARGSKEAGHRLCGNGVSRWIWESIGAAFGLYCLELKQFFSSRPASLPLFT